MKKLLTIITIMIISLIGITSVNAATVNYTYKKYRIQFYSLSQGTSAWTSVEDFGTRQPFSSGYGVSGVSARFGWSSRFQAGTTYRVTLDWGVAPLSARSNYAEVNSYSCYGSTSTSNWSADASLIQTCNLVGTTLVPNGGAIRYIFDITPLQTVIGLQVNAFSGQTEEITGANVYTSSTITYGEDATGAINDQTVIIQDEFEELTNTITEINENLINAITEDNEVCEVIDRSKSITSGYLTNTGTIGPSNAFKITDYIKIDTKTRITMLETYTAFNTPNICFYNINKALISCIAISSIQQNEIINIPNNSSYIRISINNDINRPQVKICKNGNQALIDADHNYTKEDITGTVEQEEELKEDIDDMLDTSYMDDWDIDLNTDSAQYVWNKMTLIYNTNQKWANFLMAILGLGIIKLILGR